MGLLDIALAPRVAAKAEIGPGVASILMNPQASGMFGRRDPNLLMAEAQLLYKRNAWVASAERAVWGRILQTPWRIEDDEGTTVTPQTHPAASDLLNALGDAQPLGEGVSITQLATSTRRGLWAITLRHIGLCGNAFWLLDERELLTGTPRRVLYINPARMTPAVDRDGIIRGWVLDHPENRLTKPGTRPVPLMLEEVQQFILEPDEDSPFGIGIAEAANGQAELNRLSTGHATSTMALGGRLTGIVSPVASSTVQVNEDQWDSIVRDWRNLASDPNSAKRLQVIRAPVEFTQLAASPADLQLGELMSASRDDIFAAWSVPTSQVGIAGAAGLNSGEARADDAEVLWEGACKPRLDAFRDGLQRVLNLWEPRLGFRPHLVFDVPSFDDLEPAYVVAEKAKVLPLTHNERRALVGLDPLEDEALGKQIWLDQSIVLMGPAEAEDEPTGMEAAESESVKAELTGRQKVEARWVEKVRDTAVRLLAEQRDAIAAAIEARWDAITRKPTDDTAWWKERWTREWQEAFEPLHRGIGGQASVAARTLTGKADPIGDVVDVVAQNGAARVTGITSTTRDAIRAIVRLGVSEGLSPAEVATKIRDLGEFDPARAEMIARTETMLAYNEATLGTYGRLGVELVDALDGDADDECASRVANNPWPVAEAYSQTDHPNGTLDWVPVMAKATAPAAAPWAMPAITFAPTFQAPDWTVNIPEQPAPIVNVAASVIPPPVVTVEAAKAPDVTVVLPEQAAPVVNVEAAKADTVQRVEIVSMPRRVKQAKRNRKGEVEGTVEIDG